MHAELQIILPAKGEKYILMPGEYVILGRGDTADIVLGDDPSLSRLHCKIFYQSPNFWIEDLGSRNRSFVNQKPISKQILKSKDKIYIGRYQILFQIVMEEKSDYVAEREPFNALKNSDKLTGRIAVELKLITKENLKSCVKIQEEMVSNGPYYPLAEVLEQEGFLSKEDMEKIENFKKQISFRIANYKLQELIGMGGMGRIYLARCLKTGALRACKIFCEVPEEFQKQIYEQFQRESQALLSLDHINIVKGIEKGDTDKATYLVMEYIDGTTLKGYLKEKGDRLLADEALNIVLQLARALEHAYAHGMVHRDIKPDNVMITKEKIAKLCDFGLVKNSNIEYQEENVFGTVAYMSPEQIRSAKNIDIRSDIYSLGALFYRILFGKLPFVGDSKKICKQHLQENITFPNDGQHPQKKELSKIIRKMMAKNPDARYATPKELIYDLEIVKAMFFQKDLGRTEEVPYSRKALGTTSRLSLPRAGKLKKIAFSLVLLLILSGIGFGVFFSMDTEKKVLKATEIALEEKNYPAAEKIIRNFLKKYPHSPEIKNLQKNLQQILLQQIEATGENFFHAVEICQEIQSLGSQTIWAQKAVDILASLETKEKERKLEQEFQKELSLWDRFLQEGKYQDAERLFSSLETKAITKEKLDILEKRREVFAQSKLQKELSLCRYYKAHELPPSSVQAVSSSSDIPVISFLLGGAKPVLDKPFPSKGLFFLPVSGYLHCLKSQDGSVLWSFPYGDSDNIRWILLSGEKEVSQSLFADRILICGKQSNTVKMFSLNSGDLLWEALLPEKISSDPLWAEGSLLVCCQNRFCYRLDSRGKILGAFLTKAAISNKPVFDSPLSLLYLSEKEHIYIFQTQSGKLQDYLLASYAPFQNLLSKTDISFRKKVSLKSKNPQICEKEDTILVFDTLPKLYDATSLKFLWAYDDPKKSFPGESCTGWQHNGSVSFIGTQVGNSSWGHALVLNPSKKELLWQRRIGSGFTEEAILTKKNFVWLGRNDGSLFQMAQGKNTGIPKYRMNKGHPYWDIVTHLLYLQEKDQIVIIRNKGISKMIHASAGTSIQDWNFRESWNKAAPGLGHRDEEFLFFAPEKSLCAFSLVSGRKLSKDYQNEYNFTTPLQHLKGSLFIGDESGKFYRFQMQKANEGIKFQKIWEVQNSGTNLSIPYISTSSIYLGCNKGILSRLHPVQGKSLWECQTDAAIQCQPLVKETMLYIGNESGAFYAIKSNTGEIAWQKKLEGSIYATPLSQGTKIYVATQQGFVYALDSQTGSDLWSTRLEGKIQKAFFLWNNMLYVACENDFLYIIEKI